MRISLGREILVANTELQFWWTRVITQMRHSGSLLMSLICTVLYILCTLELIMIMLTLVLCNCCLLNVACGVESYINIIC